ncbi:uncharacterized protein LOC123316576 isoform X1 [Coccinella septempunctata]|uniref:uncharacterized protein LOC123316576 isoform X1 n=1 Tax=Coccinella septempunctata TaxID=41139 RepID=UPI001D07E648|nr:uncharacterized protein LOC123316576 isoform X1 [Coccinella septempunctata]
MSRIIEQFLDKKLHEYGRKSKTILIIYKCRHAGITKTRLQKKKRESTVKQTYKDHTNTDIRSSEIDSENGNKDILETILKTWSSSLETDMSKFFEEPENTSSNSVCPSDETDRRRFPYQGSDTIKPVYYWNIETENIKQKLEECCDCSKKRTPRTPPLHIDAISRLRLQSFIRSLCENKCNSKLCQPEEELDKETPTKCKQKRRKNKKNCKCKKDSSMVSFHVTVPKQTKSVILKNNPNPTKAKTDKTDNSNETNKNDDDSNKCLNCPHFNKNNKVQCAPITQKSTIVEPGDITLSLGNQTITISVKQANDNGESVRANSPAPKCSNPPTEQLNERTKCAYSQNKNSSQGNAQFSTSCRKSMPSNNADEKTCECLQKIKESMEEDLKKFVISQLKFSEKPSSNPPANEHQEVIKCRLLKNKLEKLRRDRQNQNSYCRNSTSFQRQQSKKTKYSGKQDFREYEEDDESDETPVKRCSTNKYPRCVKICLERQREDETSEEQEEECDCENRFRSTGTGNRRLCEHEACPWKNKRNKVKGQNNQKPFPGQSPYKCPFYDADKKPRIKNRMNKCCSCSLTIMEKEKKKCECPKSKKKPPKLQDKCCQCQPNQSKNTQFETMEHQPDEPNETTQDTSGVNEDTVDESTDQSRRTSVEEAFVVNMESPNRNSSKAVEVQESDLEGKDESCSCCICDKESSDDVDITEYPCDLSSGSEEDDPPIRKKYTSGRRNRQPCDCEVDEVASTEKMRRRSMVKSPKSQRRSRNTRNSNFNTFCGDNDREESKHHKKSNNIAKQDITSTEDLIECECEEFEQLLAELEEYCKTKCVNFKVLPNRENSGYDVPEKKLLSITSTPRNSAFVVQNDRSNISGSFHAHPSFSPTLSKKFFEKNAFVLRSQGLFRISSKKSRSKEKVRYCPPRKTSSKLSDQRLMRRRRIESLYKKSRIEEKIGFLLL